MGFTFRLLALAAVGCVMAWGWFADGGEPKKRKVPVVEFVTESRQTEPYAIGSAGCAANGCHGNTTENLPPLREGPLANLTQPADCWKTSYLQWASRDKHARAYEVLKNERSKRIVRNWKKLPQDSTEDGTEYQECLACHSNPTLARRIDPEAIRLQQEGVGCESCHGDAEIYRTRHTGWPADSKRTKAEYEAVGMKPLFDPHVRAEVCAGCHVGAPAGDGAPLRDVHHDLIAAGHPRLNFDFASYSRRMPAHWRERDRAENKERPAGFEGDFWAIGQIASAETALKLLYDRATSPEAKSRWPELAEFNCYSCHHNLQPESWRPQAADPKRPFGAFVWNQPGIAPDKNAALAVQLKDVRAALEQSLAGKAGSDGLPNAIKDAMYSLRNAAADHPKLDPAKLFTADDLARLDWDQAARLYQALVAATNARLHRDSKWAGKDDAEKLKQDLFKALQFDRTKGLDSPAEHNPEKVRKMFLDWQKLFQG